MTLFAGTAVSKILGFMRDVLTASFFGASAAMDAFLVALSVPSIIGYALGTSLSAAFIPVSTRMQHAPGKDPRQLNRSVIVVATALAVALTIAVIAGARPLISAIAPELPSDSVTITVVLTRVLSLLIIGYVLYYLSTGIYHARSHFVTPSWIQPAENVIVILVLVLLYAVLGIKALILATLAGVLGLMTLMLIPLVRNGELIGTGSNVQEETTAVLKGAAPLVVVYCVYQGYFLIERYFASGLPIGSISSLTYARRIIELPTIFFVSTLSAAMYPRLTSLFVQGDRQAVAVMLLSATTKLLYIMVPITVVLLVWSREVVALVFHRGAFDADAVRSTSAALFYYSMGLLPLAGMAITSRILYAMNDMKVPFIASVLGVVVNILGNLLLKTTLGIGGIALSTSMMFFCIYSVQAGYLQIKGIDLRIQDIIAILAKVLACSALALIVPLVIAPFHLPGVIKMLVFLVTYLGMSVLLLNNVIRELFGSIKYYRKPAPQAGTFYQRTADIPDRGIDVPRQSIMLLLLADPRSPHTIRWARSLSRSGMRVAVFGLTEPRPGDFEPYGIATYSMHFTPETVSQESGNLVKVRYLRSLMTLRSVIREYQPDIVHAHYATSYGLLGALAGFHPFVLSVWGTDVYDFPKRSLLHRSILRYNFRYADRILSTSHAMAREVRRHTEHDISVTPFGIDTARFKPCRTAGPFPDNALVIGTIKKLESIYGIDHLIQAFKLLKDRNPDLPLRLLIVGGGSKEHALRDLARTLDVDADTVFTGEVSHDETPNYHNMITIFAALSLEESFGVSVLEASACGRPVVATRVGGLPEVVDHERTGLLVPPGDVRSAADALEMLVKDPALRAAMGTAGRELVKRRFDWAKSVDQMMDIYHQVLKTASGRRPFERGDTKA